MNHSLALMLMLALAQQAFGQYPPQAPPVVKLPPQAPPVVDDQHAMHVPIRFDRSYEARPVVTEIRTLPAQAPVCGNLALKQGIAKWRTEGGSRSWTDGDFKARIKQETGYGDCDLDGLTEDELKLLYGWHLSRKQWEVMQSRPAYIEQPPMMPMRSFGGFRGGGC